MKNLKRFLLLLFCLSIFINPLFVFAVNDPPSVGNTWGEAESASGYDSTEGKISSTNNLGGDGLGYYIKLIKYNSSTKQESIVGKPILLHSGGFLNDITRVDGDAGDASVDTNRRGNTLLCVGKCEQNIGNSAAPNGGSALHIRAEDNPISYGQQVGEAVSINGATYYTVTLKPSGLDANGNIEWSAASDCASSSTAVYSAEQLSYYIHYYINN